MSFFPSHMTSFIKLLSRAEYSSEGRAGQRGEERGEEERSVPHPDPIPAVKTADMRDSGTKGFAALDTDLLLSPIPNFQKEFCSPDDIRHRPFSAQLTLYHTHTHSHVHTHASQSMLFEVLDIWSLYRIHNRLFGPVVNIKTVYETVLGDSLRNTLSSINKMQIKKMLSNIFYNVFNLISFDFMLDIIFFMITYLYI